MKNINFDVWAAKQRFARDQIEDNEQKRLNALRQEIEPVHALDWWTEYKNVGNNPRGNHFGVKFGFGVDDDRRDETSHQIEKIARDFGFEFKIVRD